MKEKLVLTDGTELEIEGGAELSNVLVVFDTKYDMINAWDKLTESNLSKIQFTSGSGEIFSEYENLILDSETSTIKADGKILTSFHLREKTEVELLKERIAMLEEGQEVQDGAIADLGEAVSELAEEGGVD